MRRSLNVFGESQFIVFAAILIAGATALPGCGDGLSDYERQQLTFKRAEDHIKELGGKAAKKGYPLGEAWAIDLTGAKVTDVTIESLATLAKVAELNLSKSEVTDAHLAKLSTTACGVLYKLDLSGTGVTDAGLEHLAVPTFLAEIKLRGSKATPAGVANLKAKRAANPNVMAFAKNVKIEL